MQGWRDCIRYRGGVIRHVQFETIWRFKVWKSSEMTLFDQVPPNHGADFAHSECLATHIICHLIRIHFIELLTEKVQIFFWNNNNYSEPHKITPLDVYSQHLVRK